MTIEHSKYHHSAVYGSWTTVFIFLHFICFTKSYCIVLIVISGNVSVYLLRFRLAKKDTLYFGCLSKLLWAWNWVESTKQTKLHCWFCFPFLAQLELPHMAQQQQFNIVSFLEDHPSNVELLFWSISSASSWTRGTKICSGFEFKIPRGKKKLSLYVCSQCLFLK